MHVTSRTIRHYFVNYYLRNNICIPYIQTIIYHVFKNCNNKIMGVLCSYSLVIVVFMFYENLRMTIPDPPPPPFGLGLFIYTEVPHPPFPVFGVPFKPFACFLPSTP